MSSPLRNEHNMDNTSLNLILTRASGPVPGKDPRLLLSSAEDTCLIVCAPIPAGSRLRLGVEEVAVWQTLTRGVTIARQALHQGDKVVRHGIVIGTVAYDLEAGDRLHSRALESDCTRAQRWPRRVARYSSASRHPSCGISDRH